MLYKSGLANHNKYYQNILIYTQWWNYIIYKGNYKRTLWETQQVDAILSFSGDGLYGSAETLDLLPQWFQAVHIVEQINHCHLSAWMHLRERAQQYRNRLTRRLCWLHLQPDSWQCHQAVLSGVCLHRNSHFLRTCLRELKRGLKTWTLKPLADSHFTYFHLYVHLSHLNMISEWL